MKYEEIKTLLAQEPLPALLIDLDALDSNIQRTKNKVLSAGKNLRIASKSLRIPELYRYIQEKGGAAFKGILCYSVAEAKWLYEQGFRDLLVAYPAVQRSDFEIASKLLRFDPQAITFMVDCPEHLKIIQGNFNDFEIHGPAAICIDIDVSYRPFGYHLGVQRSPLRTLTQIKALLDLIAASPKVKLVGAMGYEAQIAGLGEKNPFSRLLNPLKRLLKWFSVKDVRYKRELFIKEIQSRGITLQFFNGGGTGSIVSTLSEPWITEITVGSGFLQSHLFDYYSRNENEPAVFFALPVTRTPEPGMVTCQGGGFIASGETSPDKAPQPYLPEGLRPLAGEGFGEVQTPLKINNNLVAIGDLVLCRPAKSGEIAEHFQEALILRGSRIISRMKTYRGHGLVFY